MDPGPGQGRISRAFFEDGCRRYLAKYSGSPCVALLGAHQYARGWLASSTPGGGGLGLTRTLSIVLPEDSSSLDTRTGCHVDVEENTHVDLDLDLDLDRATLSMPRPQVLHVEQSIFYSSTWQVPVLYFTAIRDDGTPVSLDELFACSLLGSSSLPSSETVFSTSNAHVASFPTVSQADHPTSGRPSFYLHPCETAGFLSSILCMGAGAGAVEYIEAFVMFCSNAIEMRA